MPRTRTGQFSRSYVLACATVLDCGMGFTIESVSDGECLGTFKTSAIRFLLQD